MFNAISKSPVIGVIALSLVACGNKELSPEMQLYQSAEAAYEARDFDRAILLLDSLDHSKPKDTEAMRLSMDLRPRAIKEQSTLQLAVEDSIIEANRLEMERLQPMFAHVALPEIEGYWVDAKQYNPDFLNTTGISGRVTEIGEFYIVSSLNPAGGLKHNSLTVKVGNEEASTPVVPYDGAINFRISGSEMITFSPEQSDSIGMLLANRPGEKATVKFNGENGKSKVINLTAAQADAIGTAYNFAKAINGMRDATIRREKLNAIIQLADKKIDQRQAQQQ